MSRTARCCATDEGGYQCELPPDHVGPHRAVIDAVDEEGPIPERTWITAPVPAAPAPCANPHCVQGYMCRDTDGEAVLCPSCHPEVYRVWPAPAPEGVMCARCGHAEGDHDGYGGLCDGLGGNASRTVCGCTAFMPDPDALDDGQTRCAKCGAVVLLTDVHTCAPAPEATRRVPYRLIAEDAAIRPAAMSVVKPSEAVALLNATVDENERLRATVAAQARENETLRADKARLERELADLRQMHALRGRVNDEMREIIGRIFDVLQPHIETLCAARAPEGT